MNFRKFQENERKVCNILTLSLVKSLLRLWHLRQDFGPFGLFVAKWAVCRNKLEKNLADCLESDGNRLTFALEKIFDS